MSSEYTTIQLRSALILSRFVEHFRRLVGFSGRVCLREVFLRDEFKAYQNLIVGTMFHVMKQTQSSWEGPQFDEFTGVLTSPEAWSKYFLSLTWNGFQAAIKEKLSTIMTAANTHNPSVSRAGSVAGSIISLNDRDSGEQLTFSSFDELIAILEMLRYDQNNTHYSACVKQLKALAANYQQEVSVQVRSEDQGGAIANIQSALSGPVSPARLTSPAGSSPEQAEVRQKLFPDPSIDAEMGVSEILTRSVADSPAMQPLLLQREDSESQRQLQRVSRQRNMLLVILAICLTIIALLLLGLISPINH